MDAIFNCETPSIHKLQRHLKKRETCSLFNLLCSIAHDASFLDEIRLLYPSLPLFANIRCGLWYTKGNHDATCYFKSTDGHNNNWGFSLVRLNLNVAHMAASQGGCLIVDATRRGKVFSDALSKTVPIWCCVINRTIQLITENSKSSQKYFKGQPCNHPWDSSLHLPLWVPSHEAVQINERIDGWVKALCDLLGLLSGNESSQESPLNPWGDLHQILKKPLQPLWISQSSRIWTDSIAQPEDLAFTPIILVSASAPHVANSLQRLQSSSGPQYSFIYIPGAGDDEESWAEGITPADIWASGAWEDILSMGPSVTAAQIKQTTRRDVDGPHNLRPMGCSGMTSGSKPEWPDLNSVYRIGPSLFLGRLPDPSSLSSSSPASDHTLDIWDRFSLILDVSLQPKPWLAISRYLWLPIANHKKDHQALTRALPLAMSFLSSLQPSHLPMLIIDDPSNGPDSNESVCICLSFLLFSQNKAVQMTKQMLRQTLAFISSSYPLARPTKSFLRDVYNFLLHTNYRVDNI